MTEVIVLGAGMVGVSTALALQAHGFSVALVDRRAPGRETSYGNAGFIQTEAVEPYAFPLAVGKLLAIAAKRTNDVNWHMAAMPRLIAPLLAYFGNSFPARHRAISAVYCQMIRRAADDHAPLIAAAGAEDLIRRTGFVQAYRSPRRMDEAVREAEHLRADYGVDARALAAAAVRAEEPLLRRDVQGAIFWPEPWTCANPGALVAAYAALFVSRGGNLRTGDAATLTAEAGGWRVTTEDGPLAAERAVVALGPWSPDLLGRFGYRVPMLKKRGYHRHYRMETPLRRPFMDAENAAVCAMTTDGLRICTGAELTAVDAPPDLRQLRRAEGAIRELLPLGEAVESEPWFGHRPCMPDMLPVVGAAPRHPGLWLHFGHGHQGFTLGPTTANILAELMSGGETTPLARRLAFRQ